MHTHAANPYDPQPTAIDNHEYTLRNNAIVSGSQTPDLGFVLLPLYDAILPHLNWHLHHGIWQHDGAACLHATLPI